MKWSVPMSRRTFDCNAQGHVGSSAGAEAHPEVSRWRHKSEQMEAGLAVVKQKNSEEFVHRRKRPASTRSAEKNARNAKMERFLEIRSRSQTFSAKESSFWFWHFFYYFFPN